MPEKLSVIAARNLQFWLTQAEAVHTSFIPDEILSKKSALWNAITMGMRFPETHLRTAQLVSALYPMVERDGMWEEWLPIVQTAIDFAPAESPLFWILRNQEGVLLERQHQYEAACAAHLHVIEGCDPIDNSVIVAEAHFYLCIVYYRLGKHDEANKIGVIAQRDWIKPQGKTEHIYSPLINILGLIAYDRGAFEDAIKLFHNAISHWQKQGHSRYLASGWHNLGRALVANNQGDEAEKAWQSGLDCLAVMDDVFLKASIWISHGNLYMKQKRWDAAETAFRAANSHELQATDDWYWQALAMCNLGEVLLNKGAWDEAEGVLKRGLIIWNTHNDRKVAGHITGLLAQIALYKGAIPEACTLFDEAIVLLSSLLHEKSQDRWIIDRIADIQLQKEKAC